MRIDGLEQAERDPDVHGEDVQVAGEEAVEEGSADGTHSQNEDFERVSVLCRETEGCRILVVNFVDVLVQRAVVQRLVGEVVPCVLEDEEESNLAEHGLQVGERNLVGCEPEVFSDRVEEPNLRT